MFGPSFQSSHFLSALNGQRLKCRAAQHVLTLLLTTKKDRRVEERSSSTSTSWANSLPYPGRAEYMAAPVPWSILLTIHQRYTKLHAFVAFSIRFDSDKRFTNLVKDIYFQMTVARIVYPRCLALFPKTGLALAIIGLVLVVGAVAAFLSWLVPNFWTYPQRNCTNAYRTNVSSSQDYKSIRDVIAV